MKSSLSHSLTNYGLLVLAFATKNFPRQKNISGCLCEVADNVCWVQLVTEPAHSLEMAVTCPEILCKNITGQYIDMMYDAL